ncbi:MAG: hypothetical protein Q7V14_01675 [Coriobacteriia bacterium]|nr:hypothetical protein [Coriobacteriia bacterium]MDO9107446.1 hypothetical protein [Coriobacteriia bacterium]
MMFFWLPFLILVPIGVFWMLRSGTVPGCCGMDHSGRVTTPGVGAGSEPIDIARLRLARGEITTAQFDEIRRALG